MAALRSNLSYAAKRKARQATSAGIGRAGAIKEVISKVGSGLKSAGVKGIGRASLIGAGAVAAGVGARALYKKFKKSKSGRIRVSGRSK